MACTMHAPFLFSNSIQKDEKFDVKLAREAFTWINGIVTEQTLKSPSTQQDVQEALQDGYVLAKLVV